jgi:hypothetical protein
VEGTHWLLGMLSGTLSSILRHQARFDQALSYAERALTISETLFGPVHPKVAVGLFNLASVQEKLGHYVKAREHF